MRENNQTAIIMRKQFILFALILGALAIGVCSCKAWRTVTTTATCVQVNDSSKVSTTIQTKTLEEYTGKKQN